MSSEQGKITGFDTLFEGEGGHHLYVSLERREDGPVVMATDGYGHMLVLKFQVTPEGQVVLSESFVDNEWTDEGEPKEAYSQSATIWTIEEVSKGSLLADSEENK